MLSNLSRRITRRNPNRPARSDKAQPNPDKVVLKAVPKMVPQNAKRQVLLGFPGVMGVGGAQERQSINLDIHLIIDTYDTSPDPEWS